MKLGTFCGGVVSLQPLGHSFAAGVVLETLLHTWSSQIISLAPS